VGLRNCRATQNGSKLGPPNRELIVSSVHNFYAMTTHENVSPRDALDVVFVNRNRAYGAYQLRREYPDNLSRALGFGLLLMAFLFVLPRIVAAFSTLIPENPPMDYTDCRFIVDVKLSPPPPRVLSAAPPPAKATFAFKPPVVAPDQEVPDEHQTDVQAVLADTREVGTRTVDGPPEGPPTLDPISAGLGEIELPKHEEDEPMDGFAVHKMPSFPGGDAEMFKWIYKHIQYPDQAREAGISGPVVLQFVIGKDGSIGDIVVVKTPAGGAILGKEAIRVIQSMPKWSPGEANGRAVKVRFTLPLRFELK
jgi:protein TonB